MFRWMGGSLLHVSLTEALMTDSTLMTVIVMVAMMIMMMLIICLANYLLVSAYCQLLIWLSAQRTISLPGCLLMWLSVPLILLICLSNSERISGSLSYFIICVSNDLLICSSVCLFMWLTAYLIICLSAYLISYLYPVSYILLTLPPFFLV